MEPDIPSSTKFSKVYLTGYGNFAGVESNPCLKLVEALKSQVKYSAIIEVDTVSAQKGLDELYSEIENAKEETAYVVHIGVVGSRTCLSLECRGKNIMDFRVPDNRGFQPSNEPIEKS